jgi:hypothetical protein
MRTRPRWSRCCAPSRRASATLLIASLLCWPERASAQELFGLSVQVGRTNTLTPYRRNVVLAEATSEFDAQGSPLVRPSLVDEEHAWDTSFGIEVLLDRLEFGLKIISLPRTSVLRHHEGTSLISRRRERADGTFDDAGVIYRPIDPPETRRVAPRGRGDLLIVTLNAGRRFYLYEDAFTVFIPVGGGFALTNVDDPGLPYRFGLDLYTGLGGSYKLSKNIEIGLLTRLTFVATFEYEPGGDAARRGAALGESTMAALFSTTLLPELAFTFTYIVR